MNKERAKELIPIMQAYVEGKEIEIFSDGQNRWVNIIDPNFEPYVQYRIKPEPFECWNNIYKNYSDSFRSEKEALLNCNDETVFRRAVLMREVMK